MSWGKKLLALAGAYLATIVALIPLVLSIIYLLSRMPSVPTIVIYLALGLCIMIGVGLLRWFNGRIGSRLQ